MACRLRMGLLLETRTVIEDHWRTSAIAMAENLPGGSRVHSAYWDKPAGTSASLRCQAFPNEIAIRQDGISTAPIVPLIASSPGESPIYWMGWYETWAAMSTRRLRFCSSGITVHYGPEGVPKRQLFRAEWSGVIGVEKEIDIFQGRGAAHPHWHIDAVQSYLDDMFQQMHRWKREVQLRATADAVQEFGAEGAPQEDSSDAVASLVPDSELSWTQMHFAANARWSKRLWPGSEGPHDVHAVGPENVGELRSWLASCVRYIQSEINKPLSKGHMV